MLALTAACHAATAPGTAAPSPTTEATAAPSPFDGLDLNLGFEQADTPQGWKVAHADYAVSIDGATAFEGAQSLAMVHDGIHESGRVRLELPAQAVRGKQLTAIAHVRTQGVDRGGVGLRLYAGRGDDGLRRAQTPPQDQLRGDHDWAPLSLEMSVPAEADEVTLILDHAGTGTAWFDGIELRVSEVDGPPPPSSLSGSVLDDAGRPVADALVGVFSHTGEHWTAQTDASGHFSVPVPPGGYELGASAEAGVGNVRGITVASGAEVPVEVRLATGAQRLHGTLRDQAGQPVAGALAVLATADEHVYPTRTAADGTWSLTIPKAPQYMAMFQGDQGQRAMAMIEDPDAPVDAMLHREGAAPAAAIDWIRDHHVPLRTVEAGHGLDDLAALDPVFSKAKVVGLGEATHGTREFFQLKHRMLEYLVERHGFSVFGIEANRTECRAIDRYVQTGEGDPREALAGIYFWTWNTHEVLDLIEWMRQYNESHPRKLRFVGFDAQTPNVAARNVVAFLDRVDATAPGRETVARLGQPFNHQAFMDLSNDERQAVAEALDGL
ncbi:MAG: erythromycin esterase family protein, partial [Myxococcales bacterium]|nr:erythromycin esterase family protein [Myxococcales bacterium]